jgi:hypothetical protein
LKEGKQNLTAHACRDRKVYDKRTPGLFKLEYEGDLISFCSKTYYCFRAYNKTSTKDLRQNPLKNKRQNNLGKDIFDKVLDTEQAQREKRNF